MGKYALVSKYDSEERYSADAGDYWDSPADRVFKDSQGINVSLAEMGYDSCGNSKVKRIVKRKVTVKDLRNLESSVSIPEVEW